MMFFLFRIVIIFVALFFLSDFSKLKRIDVNLSEFVEKV